MDRTLKERIIGAVVLVVFAILVVPIFLDGPPDQSEVVSETVRLPGQSSQKMQTQVLERNRANPVPASKDASAEPVAEKPKPTILAMKDVASEAKAPKREPTATSAAPAKPKPAKPDPELPSQAPPETSSTGMWAVQLGSFSDQSNADKLAADLRKRGYAAFLSKLSTQKGQLHRVRIGPQANREAALTVAKKLDLEGHKGQVVPHP